MSQYFDGKDLFVGPKTTQYGSHMVMTQVAKESKIKYLNIDSRFRDEYGNQSLANCSVTLPERINDVHKIRAMNAEIPMSFYNISNFNGNAAFILTDNTGNHMVTAADGYYSTASSLFTALTPTSLSYSVVANRVVIRNTSTTDNITVHFDVDDHGDTDKYTFKNKLGWLLGFRKQSYTISKNNGTITAESMYDLHQPRYLYLVVDEYGGSGKQNSFVCPLPKSLINKQILARITLDYTNFPFGSVLTANTFNGYLLSDTRSYNGRKDLQKLNVELVNEYGDTVELNGLDFSVALEIEHE
jgi:hypothetical protein